MAESILVAESGVQELRETALDSYERARSYLGRWYVVVAALPVVIPFVLLLNATATNLPVWDDFETALRFVARFRELESGRAKFLELFAQHNEHRMVFNRLTYLVSGALLGTVDFAAACLPGWIAMGVFWAVLVARCRSAAPLVQSVVGIAVAAAIFHPGYGGDIIWSTTTIQNFLVIALALGTFLLLERPTIGALGAALFCSACAVFCQGNGLLVPVIGSVQLLAAKRYRHLLAWLLVSGMVIGAFFLDHRPTPPVARYGDLTPYGFAQFFLLLVGRSLGGLSVLACVGAGAVLFAMTLGLSIACRRSAPGLVAMAGFFIGSLAVAGILRFVPVYDVNLAPTRYVANSSFLIAVLCALAAHLGRAGIVMVSVTTGLAFLANQSGYRFGEPELYRHQARQLTTYAQWMADGRDVMHPDPKAAERVLFKSLRKGVFRWPAAEFGRIVPTLPPELQLEIDYTSASGSIDIAVLNHGFLVLHGWGCISNFACSRQTAYVRLRSENSVYVVETRRQLREDLEFHLRDQNFRWSGFVAAVPVDSIAPGAYSLELVMHEAEHLSTVPIAARAPLVVTEADRLVNWSTRDRSE